MASTEAPGLSDYTAIEVNGEQVSLGDVLRLAKMTGRLQLLDEAVDAALVAQAAAERGIKAGDDELQRAADEFRASRGLHTAKATVRWLEERQLTFSDWEALVERDLIKGKLREELFAGRAEQHFVENRLLFDEAELSQIVVRDEDVARELRAQVCEDGADFHALARAHSIDAATNRAGGYMGRVRRPEMEASLEAAVFGARPGKIVGPVKTDAGWRLVKVEALHTATPDERTIEMVKSLLFDEWLAERRRKARVRLPLLEGDAGQ